MRTHHWWDWPYLLAHTQWSRHLMENRSGGILSPCLMNMFVEPPSIFSLEWRPNVDWWWKVHIRWKTGGMLTIHYDRQYLLPITRGFNGSEQVKVIGAIYLCVTDETNQNLMGTQKKWPKWHFCLGHMGFGWLQAIARMNYLPKWIANCNPPLCASCQLGAAQHNSSGKAIHTKLLQDKGGNGRLKEGDCLPGQCLSID